MAQLVISLVSLFANIVRLRAVPLQSVESKLGRTGESELDERETFPPPPQLPLVCLSLSSEYEEFSRFLSGQTRSFSSPS